MKAKGVAREKCNRKEWISPQNIIGMMLIGINMAVFFYYNYTHINSLNSDTASEMILSSLLAEENGILSKQWIYSTELRVFNTQIIMGILFRFLEDWSLIRAVGNLFLYLAAYLSGVFMLRQLGVSKGNLCLSAAIILLPFSDYQCDMLLVGGFYIPHITFTFFIVGMILRLLFHKPKSRNLLLGGALYLLSLAAGLGGIRYLLLIFAPLCLVELWNLLEGLNKGTIPWKRTGLIGSAAAAACAGYFIYSNVLSKYYPFDSYNNILFIDLNAVDMGERFFRILSGTLNYFGGYRNGCKFFSLGGVGNLCAFICIFVVAMAFVYINRHYMHEDSPYNTYYKFTLCTVLINFFIFLFTDKAFSADNFISRYSGPVLIHCLLSVFIYLGNITQKQYRRCVCAIYMGALLLLGIVTTKELFRVNYNEGRLDSLSYIQEENMGFGYATFWNANISTELTDGEVKIAPVQDFQSMAVFEYLTLKEYLEEDYSDGKCFILMTVQEQEDSAGSPVLLGGTKEYEDEFFVVYTYPDSASIYGLAVP